MKKHSVAQSSPEDANTVPQVFVDVKGATRIFSERPVLDRLDLEIPSGQFVAMLGASGSGKTTFLKILAGLEQADEGQIRVPKQLSVVFQEPRLIMSQRVWRNVLPHRRWNSRTRNDAIAALAEVGLSSHADAWPRTLSGGEAQRVALARALAQKPALMLLDEPFAALDALTRLTMQALVEQLFSIHKPAILLVTHDADEAIRLADRIVVLKNGRLSLDLQSGIRSESTNKPEYHQQIRLRLLQELGVQQERR